MSRRDPELSSVTVPAREIRKGEIVKTYHRVGLISYGAMEGPVIKAGPKNLVVQTRVRFTPDGPWFEQEHRIPREHIEYVLRGNLVHRIA